MWIIDFGTDMSEADASMYEAPFKYVVENVRPEVDCGAFAIKRVAGEWVVVEADAFMLTLVVLYLALNWLPTLVVAKGHPPSEGFAAAMAFNIAGVIGTLALGAFTVVESTRIDSHITDGYRGIARAYQEIQAGALRSRPRIEELVGDEQDRPGHRICMREDPGYPSRGRIHGIDAELARVEVHQIASRRDRGRPPCQDRQKLKSMRGRRQTGHIRFRRGA